MPLSSVVCHPPSFLRVLPTVVCPSPVSQLSSSALPSLPLTPPFFACLPSLLLLFFVPSCFHTLASFVVVVRSVPRFSVPSSHAGVTQVLMTLPLRSAGPPSPPQLLSTHSLRPVLFVVPPSSSSRLCTLPFLGTRNCPPESVYSLQLDDQLFPLVAYVQQLRLLYVNFQHVSGK